MIFIVFPNGRRLGLGKIPWKDDLQEPARPQSPHLQIGGGWMPLPHLPSQNHSEHEVSKGIGERPGSTEHRDAERLAPGPGSRVPGFLLSRETICKMVFAKCAGWRWHQWNISSKRKEARGCQAKSRRLGRRKLATGKAGGARRRPRAAGSPKAQGHWALRPRNSRVAGRLRFELGTKKEETKAVPLPSPLLKGRQPSRQMGRPWEPTPTAAPGLARRMEVTATLSGWCQGMAGRGEQSRRDEPGDRPEKPRPAVS